MGQFTVYNSISFVSRALQFAILHVALNMFSLRKIITEMLLGYQIPADESTMDLKIAKKISAIQGIVFASLGEKIPQFIDQCIKLDERYTVLCFKLACLAVF